ncbi:aspartic proteinase-like protein 2 [Senna tora]|uniref:Aspartic proteinase-like protein 2 n=1 Tax=Senna tora TaxID=362788 RepID=A0A834SL07_9FABA|nr:aspartic proteinase-like protein 2 [Senna tora]
MLIWSAAAAIPVSLTLERAFPTSNNGMKLRGLRALDNARHRRLLNQFSNPDADFPLAGTYDPYVIGLYYTKVRLGSPPRDFHVQIDTGSDALWVSCVSCSGCPKKTTLNVNLTSFDPETSSSSSMVSCSEEICDSDYVSSEAVCSNKRCSYTFEYADNSACTGYYVMDLIHFATAISNTSSHVLFGCSTELRGSLAKNERGVDGIFGFGPRGLSVISQLSSKGLAPSVFSHCLKGDQQGGGKLVLGEILHPNIVYTPLLPSQYLQLKSIQVNGKNIPITLSTLSPSSIFEASHKGVATVVDSGTTMAYLPEGVYEHFVQAIADEIPADSVLGAYVADESLCFLTSDGKEGWCMGFQKLQVQGAGEGLILLGDIALKDRIVVYDLAGQRIGWTDYDSEISEGDVKDEVMGGCRSDEAAEGASGITIGIELSARSPCNVDGSYFDSTKAAAVGGVARDASGNFLFSFCHRVGLCDIRWAELRGVLDGLDLLWSKGFRRVVIESDSEVALDLIKNGVDQSHHVSGLVHQIRSLINQNWDAELVHVFREANHAADFMAKLSHSLPNGLHVFERPQAGLGKILANDLYGYLISRLCVC